MANQDDPVDTPTRHKSDTWSRATRTRAGHAQLYSLPGGQVCACMPKEYKQCTSPASTIMLATNDDAVALTWDGSPHSVAEFPFNVFVSCSMVDTRCRLLWTLESKNSPLSMLSPGGLGGGNDRASNGNTPLHPSNHPSESRNSL